MRVIGGVWFRGFAPALTRWYISNRPSLPTERRLGEPLP